MTPVRWMLFVLTLFGLSWSAHAADLTVLNYHDVVANPGDDRFAVSRASFVAHMDYLQQNRYRPVSLSDVERSISTGESLPDKAVLLTFDDGLKSYRDFVAPLLEIYEFPSVVSLVTAWQDGIDVPPEYLGKIMSWDDVRKVAASARVTVISHTHNLHQGIPANVRGNLRGAATTRRYYSVAQRYESETDFRARVRTDLELSVARIKQELGSMPQAIAWPYGEYDAIVAREARTLGMRVQFVLGQVGQHDRSEGLVSRTLIVDRPDAAALAALLADPVTITPRRFVEFGLDNYVGKSESEQEALLSELLERLHSLQAGAVIISPFTVDGRRAFFRTETCTLATDVLDRVVHQIRNRLNIRSVVLRIPAMAQVDDKRRFFADLSRLIRFDALLFEGAVSDAQLRMAREIVPLFRTHARFGAVGNARAARDLDFVVVAAEALTDEDPDPARLWAHLGSVQSAGKLGESITDLSRRGILHYGFTLDLAPAAGFLGVNPSGG